MEETTQTPQTNDNPSQSQDSASVNALNTVAATQSSVTPDPAISSSEPAQTVAPVNPSSVEATQTQAPTNNTKQKKILLVEDDEALASVYLTRLQAEGFEVKHVPNGEDALASAIAFKPDLVLLDVMMPKISGFDVLDIFRNTPETTNLRVVMLTALSQDADKERAMSLGVDDYLVKSQVVIAEVIDRIKHHLGVSK